MAKFDFIGDAYRARSLNANASQTINYYPETDKDGKSITALYGTPGTVTRATASGSVRGSLVYDEAAYVVADNKFYCMDEAYTLTELGSLSTSAGYVSVKTNGLVIIIVDGTYGYSYTFATNTFAQITDPDFAPNPVALDVLDGIFIVVEGGSQRFWISTDGVEWRGLDFASAESNVDNLIGCIVDHQEVLFGGTDTIEVHYNSGDVFPFTRRAVIETGMVSPGGMCKADNSVFFIGSDRVVWRLNGYSPTRASTHGVEYAIREGDISDALMWSEKREGHLFIWCQFPAINQTWVYDVSTNYWHRRAYRDSVTAELNRHRANCYFYFNNKHFIGDHSDGTIRELSMDVYDDDGDPLPAIRVCRHVADGGLRKVTHHRLQLDIEAGVGLITGQGSDPQMTLKWSDDGGHTWSDEVARTMGAIGNYNTRLIWSPLGAAYDRVYWSQVTDPVKRVIVGAALDTTVGR